MINLRGVLAVLFLVVSTNAFGQGVLSESTLDQIYERNTRSLSDDQQVTFRAVRYEGWEDFLAEIGNGERSLGEQRAGFVEMLNRQLLRYTSVGDTLYVPETWELEWKYYAPYPQEYQSGQDKIVIIHIPTQSWAAYEGDELTRWGWVSTGKPSTPTPTGRMNANWKQYFRLSNAAPPGQRWELYYVTNIHAGEGVHTHKYIVPVAGAASHGCIRMLEQDAEWVYEWTDKWRFGNRKYVPRQQGTMFLVLGDIGDGKPVIFDTYEHIGAIQYQVQLPDDPYTVPAGSYQQQLFQTPSDQSLTWQPTLGRANLVGK